MLSLGSRSGPSQPKTPETAVFRGKSLKPPLQIEQNFYFVQFYGSAEISAHSFFPAAPGLRRLRSRTIHTAAPNLR